MKSVSMVVLRTKYPYVSKDNRMKRLHYAKTYLEKPLGHWNEVLWSDEIKFNLCGSDGKVMIWRTTNEEIDPKSTVKHGNVLRLCIIGWTLVN